MTKYKIINLILKELKQYTPLELACNKNQICWQTFMFWLNQEPRLLKIYNRIKENRSELIEDSLFQKAYREGDIQAQKFFLKNRGKNWTELPDAVTNNFITNIQSNDELNEVIRREATRIGL